MSLSKTKVYIATYGAGPAWPVREDTTHSLSRTPTIKYIRLVHTHTLIHTHCHRKAYTRPHEQVGPVLASLSPVSNFETERRVQLTLCSAWQFFRWSSPCGAAPLAAGKPVAQGSTQTHQNTNTTKMPSKAYFDRHTIKNSTRCALHLHLLVGLQEHVCDSQM